MNNDLIRRSDLLAKKCLVRGHLDTGSPCSSKVTAIPVDVIERAPAVDALGYSAEDVEIITPEEYDRVFGGVEDG